MLTVYHFLLDHRVGGPHVYVDAIRTALAGKANCTIFTTGRGPLTDVALFNLRRFWRPLYLLEIPLNVVRIVFAARRSRRSAREVVFDSHGSANLAPVVAARLLRIPVVWHIHETVSAFGPLLRVGRLLLGKRPHTFVAVATKAKEAFALEKAEIIPGPVDTNYWSPEQAPGGPAKAWGAADESGSRPLRILAVCNLNPLKGVDVLLEAVSMLDGPSHTVIAGAELSTHEKYASRLRGRAAELQDSGQGARISFLGWCVRDKIRALMTACDVFVLPSRSEACPIVLLEAMSMGCVCVAADVGGVREMLPAELHDLVFEVGDIPRLSRRLEEARQLSESERTERGRIARQQAIRSFSVKRVSDLTLQCYRSLVEAP